MLKKISRKTFLDQYPEFIHDNYYGTKYIAPEVFDSYILSVNAKSTLGLCNTVSNELTKLLGLINIETINFLGETATPWLFREHDYKPVKKALDYLADNKISKSFNGAIQLTINDLPQFMKQLFWLVRCNGIVMYAHFSDPRFNVIGSICQYGRIHLSTLNEEVDLHFNKVLIETKFDVLIEGSCGGGRIYQRRSTHI